jgi:hypothetical protein
MLPAQYTTSHFRIEWRTAFREPLQFIVITVISVMSGTFPDAYRVFYMTLMTVIYGPILDRGCASTA